jgi:hypothetical protein
MECDHKALPGENLRHRLQMPRDVQQRVSRSVASASYPLYCMGPLTTGPRTPPPSGPTCRPDLDAIRFGPPRVGERKVPARVNVPGPIDMTGQQVEERAAELVLSQR